MTEKRFRKGKSILTDFPTGAIIDEKTGERYYDGIKPSYISSNELVKILNKLNDENEQLKKEYQKLKHRHSLLHDECLDIECERYSLKKDVESLEKENKELKEEVAKFKEWEKRIGDVKKEDLDMIFKMSIYEIVEAFEYYEEIIKELEE